MKSLKTIQKFSGIGRILSKIAFVLSMVGFCGCIAGLISLSFADAGVIRIGGVTLYGMISEKIGYGTGAAAAALFGWMIVCAGEAVLAKFAEHYFKNELKAGTPFTFAGAREMLRLGILTLAVPTGCAVAGSIVEGIAAGFMNIEKVSAMDMYFDGAWSIALGVMFIAVSLLCRYGAEVTENAGA